MATAQPLTFAQALRRTRLAAGLTQEELAARAGLAPRSLSDLERGVRRAPYRNTVERLANALQLPAPERAILEAAARPGISLSAVAARSQDTEGRDHMRLPLVGRAHELERLERLLAGDGPPLLLLAGEPGIGKTRLLREAAARATALGWCALEGGCRQSDSDAPYSPLVGALARHIARRTRAQSRADLQGCAWLARLLPELADSAPVPPPSWTLTPDQERRLMFAAVGRYLANVAGPAGTLLVLDDLQWAGGDALDLLIALVREPVAQPLRVIGAHRIAEVTPQRPLAALMSDLSRDERVAQAPIGPLAEGEARELFERLLEHKRTDERVEISREEAERTLRRAGGVPFFLISCVNGLRAGVAEGQAVDGVPWSVTQQIRQRVAALPEVRRTALGLAAVAGREISYWRLRAVATAIGLALEELLLGVEAACQSGLLVEIE